MRPLLRLAALSVLLLNACYPAGDGKPPPLEQLYFPTGLAVDGFSEQLAQGTAPKYLYVVNSDFDLQYRSASLISYDLEKLHQVVPQFCRTSADCKDGKLCDEPDEAISLQYDASHVPSYYCVDPSFPEPCGTVVGPRDDADLVLHPGRCESVDPLDPNRNLLVDMVGIGAFATDVVWRENPDHASARLFVPVRGDSTLHWIDVDSDGKLHCGQNESEDDDGCNSLHRAGDPVDGTNYALTQPSEPYAVDATADGEFIAITNQTSSSVSLFHNDWTAPDGPELVSILGSLPFGPVAIAALPEPKFVDEETKQAPGFLVAYRTAPQVDLLRVRSDPAQTDPASAASNYDRFALRRAGSVPISANSLGFDSRGIAIDDTLRQADYEACYSSGECSGADPDPNPTQCQACLRAVHQPSVYVASRAPSSLLVGAMTTDIGYPSGTSELPSFTDSIALTFGPSRVIVGDVKVPGTSSSPSDDAGPYEFERRIFVVCFDSRRIFVYDPKRRAIDAIVSTGRGPYALAVDRVRSLAYLGHFTDSYLGVISLDQRFPQTYATIVASIGAPKAPRSSK